MANANMQKVIKIQEEYNKKISKQEKENTALLSKLSKIEGEITELEKAKDKSIDNDDDLEFKRLSTELNVLMDKQNCYKAKIDRLKMSTGLKTEEVRQMVHDIRDACNSEYKELCLAYIEHEKMIVELLLPTLNRINEAAVFASTISAQNNLPAFPQTLDYINLQGKCVAKQNEIRNMLDYVKHNLEDTK